MCSRLLTKAWTAHVAVTDLRAWQEAVLHLHRLGRSVGRHLGSLVGLPGRPHACLHAYQIHLAQCKRHVSHAWL